MNFIDLNIQQERIYDNLIQSIKAVLAHGKYIMGPEVEILETRLAEYVNTKFCIATSSGTDSLLISMMALGLGKGDEVITTPFTFFSTVETILILGAKPVFIDIDYRTFNIDTNLIEAAINKNTKLIMPVSLYGQCADMDKINDIAKRYNLAVIEDAAQSFGAVYKEKRSCSLSTFGCTSFFPSKPLGGYGDSGAIFTNDETLAEKVKRIRVHGQDSRYNHSLLGVNGRMDTLQAAVILEKFKIFKDEIKKRAVVACNYNKLFSDYNIETPYVEEFNTSVFAQYTLRVQNRNLFMKNMALKGIPCMVHYPKLASQQDVFEKESCNLKNSIRASKEVVSIPMHPYLTFEEQKFIVSCFVESLVVS